MSVPTPVQVGPWRFGVEVVDMLEKSGRCDFDQLTIFVNSRIVDGAQRETLLHEVLHAVFNAVGLDEHLGEAETEDAILRISPLLLDTLQRNPALIDYLTSQRVL